MNDDPAAEKTEAPDAADDRPADEDKPGSEPTEISADEPRDEAAEASRGEELAGEAATDPDADGKNETPPLSEDLSADAAPTGEGTPTEDSERGEDLPSEGDALTASAAGDEAGSDRDRLGEDEASSGLVEEPVSDREAEPAEELKAEPSENSGDSRPAEPERPAPAAPPAKSGGSVVIPMIFGGIVAALIGFLVARYMDDMTAQEATGPTPEQNAAALADQASQLDEMRTTLEDVAARDPSADIAAAVDPLRSELEGAVSDLSSRLDGLSSDLTALSDRVETIAMRPVATGIDSDAFDEALTEFRAELSSAIEQANTEISQARAEAERISSEAFRAEQEAIARAAWSQVRAALEAGTPYAEPLAEAAGVLDVAVPEPVAQHAEEGVPALETLQASFPDAARNALDASIRAQTGDDPLGRLTAFLRVQSGVRSLTPKEGDDPDAILSRAEAAVRSGDLQAALAEISALPEAGQAAMSEWRAAAETRLTAISAAADLAQTMEQK